MSFAQLQQAILAEAKQQTREIKERWRQDVEKEEKRIQRAAQLVEEQAIDQAEKEGKAKAKRLHQEAQLAARADILRAKQQEMALVEEAAKAAVMAWDDDKVKTFVRALLAKMPEGGGVITPGEKHEAVVRQEAEKMSFKVLQKTVASEGGFVYSDEDLEVNVLVSELVRNVFSRHRTEIAKVLFT